MVLRTNGLCVTGAERVVDLLREHAPPRWVLRAGRLVADSEVSTHIDRGDP